MRASPRSCSILFTLACALTALPARAATISWSGLEWQVTDGGMAGVCEGDPNNVTVDDQGYLHLRITNQGGQWRAAELFTKDKLGFGTYQWQIDGPIDTFDKNIVLGLFPYGPAANIGEDGTNEIDIEYSRWGQEDGNNGDWTNYPSTGEVIGEHSYTFSLGGETLSTSRFVWASTRIIDYLFSGLEPLDGSGTPLETWSYVPATTANIPQQALPLGMNLWCFEAPPSDEQELEIVVRNFSFVPEGGVTPAPIPDAGAGESTATSDASTTTAAEGPSGDDDPGTASALDSAAPGGSAADGADASATDEVTSPEPTQPAEGPTASSAPSTTAPNSTPAPANPDPTAGASATAPAAGASQPATGSAAPVGSGSQDAGAQTADTGAAASESSSCNCRVGAPTTPSGGGFTLAVLLLGIGLRRATNPRTSRRCPKTCARRQSQTWAPCRSTSSCPSASAKRWPQA